MTPLRIFVRIYRTGWVLKEIWTEKKSVQTTHIWIGKRSLFKKLWFEIGLKWWVEGPYPEFLSILLVICQKWSFEPALKWWVEGALISVTKGIPYIFMKKLLQRKHHSIAIFLGWREYYSKKWKPPWCNFRQLVQSKTSQTSKHNHTWCFFCKTWCIYWLASCRWESAMEVF